MPEPELVLDARAQLGEGPVWDERRGVLWWLDIQRGEVHAYDIARERDTVRHRFGGEVGMLALGAGGDIIVGVGNELVRVNETGEQSVIAHAARGDRFNDGKCDSSGRLFAGTMTNDLRAGASALYRLDAGQLRQVVADVTLSNGLAWSPDGQKMYYTDTVSECIDVFDYDDATGEISGRRLLVDTSDLPGRPDGFTVDADGRLWVAMARGAAVRCFEPDGREALVIRFPVVSVTSCTIGGEGLDELWVTTATMSTQTDSSDVSGGLFRVRGLGITGDPANRWRSR